MNLKFLAGATLALTVLIGSQANAAVVFLETYDTGTPATGVAGLTVTESGGFGNISDLTAKFSNVNTGVYTVPALTGPGTVTASFDYDFTGSVLDAGDLFYLNVSVNGGNTANVGFGGTVGSGTLAFNPGAPLDVVEGDTLTVNFIIANNGFGGVFDAPLGAVGTVDNFTVSVANVAVPEPSSLAVLGLGGVAAIARRRRRR